jgi:hypothetical protein
MRKSIMDKYHPEHQQGLRERNEEIKKEKEKEAEEKAKIEREKEAKKQAEQREKEEKIFGLLLNKE